MIICGFGEFAKAVPKYEIHARAESADGTRWLRGAGATEVVDPYRLAARAIVRDLSRVSKDS